MSSLLGPTTVRVVQHRFAAELVSPPYDLLSRRERRQLAETRPRSFLNATRSPEDFPGMDSEAVIAMAQGYLADRLAEGAFGDAVTGCFVYRITAGAHVQTGVVGDVPVSAFPSRVRPHEATRVDREDQLASHLHQVGMASSPIGLTYRGQDRIDAVVARVTEGAPLLDLEVDGERQQVWIVPDEHGGELIAAFAAVDAMYIIDGHHRIAAAGRLVERLGVDASHPAGRILVVAFADHDLHVYPYDRWIESEWTEEAKWRTSNAPDPMPGQAIAIAQSGWHRLDLRPLPGEQDTTALSRSVLGPTFGVEDERTDPRLVFIPGALGKSTMISRVEQRGGTGFLLHPTSVEDLITVSDRGGVMPPKSTFFAPKPRSGIFLADRSP